MASTARTAVRMEWAPAQTNGFRGAPSTRAGGSHTRASGSFCASAGIPALCSARVAPFCTGADRLCCEPPTPGRAGADNGGVPDGGPCALSSLWTLAVSRYPSAELAEGLLFASAGGGFAPPFRPGVGTRNRGGQPRCRRVHRGLSRARELLRWRSRICRPACVSHQHAC